MKANGLLLMETQHQIVFGTRGNQTIVVVVRIALLSTSGMELLEEREHGMIKAVELLIVLFVRSWSLSKFITLATNFAS